MLDALLAELPHWARGVESNVYLLTTFSSRFCPQGKIWKKRKQTTSTVKRG
jgi:hypothetical protein